MKEDRELSTNFLPDGREGMAVRSGASRGLRKDRSTGHLLRILLLHPGCGCSLSETVVRARQSGLAGALRLARDPFEARAVRVRKRDLLPCDFLPVGLPPRVMRRVSIGTENLPFVGTERFPLGAWHRPPRPGGRRRQDRAAIRERRESPVSA